MKILCSGDREWDDIETILSVLLKYDPATTTIIEGEATGADSQARDVAEQRIFI